jgi:Na+/melibiose symporter-like transporter
MKRARNRDLALLVGSVGISALGDLLAMVPLALRVQTQTGSGAAVAVFFAALFGPIVAFGPLGGALADRVENTRLLALVSALQAAIAVALAFAGPVAAILPLTALLGAGAAIAAPVEFSLVPAVAGRTSLAAANGHVETARYAGMTAGPLLGGALAGAGLGRAALLLDALSFVLVAGAALALRARRDPRRDAASPTRGDRRRARDGLAYIARDRVLALALAAAVGALLFFSISMTAELFFAVDVLGAGGAGYGVLLTGWTLGMVVGAVALARRVPARALATGALVAVAVQGAGLLGAALSSALAFASVGFAIGGAAHGVKNVALRTLIHERVPDALRGRAYAGYNAARNAAELGALAAGGALVGAIGAREALAISGVVPLAIGVVALALLSMGGRRAAAAGSLTTRRPLHAHHDG